MTIYPPKKAVWPEDWNELWEEGEAAWGYGTGETLRLGDA